MKKNPFTRSPIGLITFGVLLYAAVMNLDSVSKGLGWLLNLLAPILMGLIFALVLNVPVHGFEHIFARLDQKQHLSCRAREIISLLLGIVTVPLLLFVLMHFIVPQFISAVTNVISIVQANEDKIADFVGRLGLDPQYITQKLNELGVWITSNIGNIAGTTVTTVVNIFSSVTNVVLAIILAIYVLADKTALRRRAGNVVHAFLPRRASEFITHFCSLFNSTFRVFLSRQCLEAVILGVLILVCMLIFRIPFAVTICCMTALLALIPYIGAFVSLAIGCVLVVTISPMKALIFACVFLVAQQVEGNLIYPRVVGKSVGLPAYITLAAVMVGGALAGILGMFFIVPVVSVFYVLLRDFVQKRNQLCPEADEGNAK